MSITVLHNDGTSEIVKWDQVHDLLCNFAAKPIKTAEDLKDTLTFPSMLTNTQRKEVHMVCNLYSELLLM